MVVQVCGQAPSMHWNMEAVDVQQCASSIHTVLVSLIVSAAHIHRHHLEREEGR